MGNQRIWTTTVTSTIQVINEAAGLLTITLVLISGTGTFIGDLNNPSASTALALTVGLPITINSKSNNALDGITIDATSGSVQIIGQQ